MSHVLGRAYRDESAGADRIFDCSFCGLYTTHVGTRCASCDTDESDLRPVVETAGWKPILGKGAGSYSDDDNVRLYDQAARWNTCAIGELLGFPRIDEEDISRLVRSASPALHDLGREFTSKIYGGDYPGALKVHREIHSGKFDADARDVLKRIGDAYHEVHYVCRDCLSGWYEYWTRRCLDRGCGPDADQPCCNCESGTAGVAAIDGEEVGN